jgi:ribose-phosphate pyrophosphokinase
VTAVIPYFAYARQDRKEKGRVPITAKLVADLLEKAGVDRVVTMDLHTEQIQGFFDIPVDNLYARPLFAPKLKGEIVVVSPDIGSNRMARKYAETLKAEIALVDKRRIGAKKVEARAVVGDVRGKKVVLVDDICSTGMTLCMAAEACREAGAREVEAVVTHAVCAGGAFTARGIDRMWISDTVPYSEGSIVGCPVEVVSAAPLFAEAMERIATNRSISSLFNQEERV